MTNVLGSQNKDNGKLNKMQTLEDKSKRMYPTTKGSTSKKRKKEGK